MSVDRRPASRAQRRNVILAVLAALAVAALAVIEAGSPAAIGADTTTTSTSSTIAGPVIPVGSFPVQGKCYFTDTYGAPRSGGRTHEGVDFIAKAGQYAYAVVDGTLTKQYLDTPGSLSGNGWRLGTTDGTYFFYAHLSGFPPGLAVGSKVVAGQIIGFVGATGNAGTPHLHFEIHPGGGAAVNPTQTVKAIDGCNVTTVPPVATNPPNPSGPADKGTPTPTTMAPTTTAATLALAVRIPVTASTDALVTTTTAVDTTETTLPTTPSVPAPAPPPPDSNPAGRWEFVEPVVLFNGSGSTALVGNVAKQVAVAGVAGLAAGTTSVMVRVSATASTAGRLIVHACAGAVPDAVTLVVEAGPMAIGTAIAEVQDGKICVTSTMTANVKLTAIAQVASGGVGLRPVLATRVLDTRATSALQANQKVSLSLAALGVSAVPGGVTATFTLVGPSSTGTLSVSPCGGAEVKAPFTNAPLSAFSLVVPVGSNGMCIVPSVSTHVVVDIHGAWESGAPSIVPVVPVRVLGTSTAGAPIDLTPIPVTIAGAGGLPATVTSTLLQITLVGASRPASVFVWPCDQARPAAAVGVVAASRTTTFAVTAAVTNGQVCVATTDVAAVFVDVSGVN